MAFSSSLSQHKSYVKHTSNYKYYLKTSESSSAADNSIHHIWFLIVGICDDFVEAIPINLYCSRGGSMRKTPPFMVNKQTHPLKAPCSLPPSYEAKTLRVSIVMQPWPSEAKSYKISEFFKNSEIWLGKKNNDYCGAAGSAVATGTLSKVALTTTSK